MATSMNIPPLSFITSSFLCVLLFGARGLCEPVPGMYVFGDSLVDVGNNNYLPLSLAKANLPHNGVDFPTGKATGRFSNGRNAADFLAEKVGLPSAPPFLSLVSRFKKLSSSNATVTGVSFASGGAGILDGTDELYRQSIPLTKQVGYYSLVHEQLVQQLDSDEAQAHLSKSLFVVVIGSNDLFNYFNKNSKASKEYTPQQFVDLMVSTLKGLLKRLYELGAHKFVISGVGVIGCCPVQRKHSATGDCNEEINTWSMKYNDGLKSLLQEFMTESSDIHYSYCETYDVMNNLIQHPETYEFTEIKEACCGRGTLKAEFPCTPISTYCSNRKNHLFWDLYHPTEHTSSLFADSIYSGPQQTTFPMNVEQLVNV
ncbi:GDSL esterase/lipase At5g55050-like [Bidens hawaiensis]|uniref:GDSL esterase/lipase At5g55050-like n=1 Tax=Bidens hawaiensis TaxID=980011 RepID=UPI004049FC23